MCIVFYFLFVGYSVFLDSHIPPNPFKYFIFTALCADITKVSEIKFGIGFTFLNIFAMKNVPQNWKFEAKEVSPDSLDTDHPHLAT